MHEHQEKKENHWPQYDTFSQVMLPPPHTRHISLLLSRSPFVIESNPNRVVCIASHTLVLL